MKYFILFFISILLTSNSFAQEKNSTKELTQSILNFQKELVKSNSKTQKKLVKSIENSGNKIQKSLDSNFSNLNDSLNQRIVLESSKIDSINFTLEKIDATLKEQNNFYDWKFSVLLNLFIAFFTAFVLFKTLKMTEIFETVKLAPIISFEEETNLNKNGSPEKTFKIVNVGNGVALNVQVTVNESDETKLVEDFKEKHSTSAKDLEKVKKEFKERINWLKNAPDFPTVFSADGSENSYFQSCIYDGRVNQKIYISATINYENVKGDSYTTIFKFGKILFWEKAS